MDETEYRNCAVWKSQDFACGRERRCLFDTYDQFVAKPTRKLSHGFHNNIVDSGRSDEGNMLQLAVIIREKSKTEGRGV